MGTLTTLGLGITPAYPSGFAVQDRDMFLFIFLLQNVTDGVKVDFGNMILFTVWTASLMHYLAVGVVLILRGGVAFRIGLTLRAGGPVLSVAA